MHTQQLKRCHLYWWLSYHNFSWHNDNILICLFLFWMACKMNCVRKFVQKMAPFWLEADLKSIWFLPDWFRTFTLNRITRKKKDFRKEKKFFFALKMKLLKKTLTYNFFFYNVYFFRSRSVVLFAFMCAY